MLVVLTCANLLYCALRYEIGYPPVSFLGTGPDGPTDNFADLVKDTLSYRGAIQALKVDEVRKWPAIFRFYYTNPEYGGIRELAEGKMVTHFHQPPLTTLYFLASAAFIVRTHSPVLDVCLFYALFLLAVQWAIHVGVPPERRTAGVVAFVWVASVLSFPGIMVLVRGNDQAGITALLITAFLLSVFIRKRFGFAALISLAIAMNIRPNAVVFLLAFPLALGLRRSLKPVLSCVALASVLLASSYCAVHRLYPDYTVSTFLRGLQIYNNLYITRSLGDSGNASLWALLKNYGTMSINHPHLMLVLSSALLLVALWLGLWHITRWIVAAPVALLAMYAQFVAATDMDFHAQAFYLFSIISGAAALWGLWSSPKRQIAAPFLLASAYCLFSPVFAEYHLLVFLAPILLILCFCGDERADNDRLISVIAIASALMLVPKNYVYEAGISLQTLLNPLILFCASLYVAVEARPTRESVRPEASPVLVLETANG
jgi:hypothetical protein